MKKIKKAALQLLFSLFLTFSFTPLALQASASSLFGADSMDNFGALNFSENCDEPPGVELTTDNCGIVAYLVLTINVMSAAAAMAIVASITLAGFQYMTAQDNAGQIEAARKRIIWALSALVIFVFMYSFLNFIVPGGVL